jgi:acetamidase/formamidase
MVEGTVHRLEPRIYYYTFGPNEPALSVKSGDSVVARTRDAGGFNEKMEPMPEEMKQHSASTLLSERNPQVGPVYIEEAEPGDILTVTIQRIKLNRDYAWSRHRSNFGSLTGEAPGKQLFLNDPVPEAKFDWQLDLEQNTGILELKSSRRKRIEIPLHPFLGSIGVAPRFGRIETSLVPGEFGGNMDCIETREGTILYLPVWVRGAYFSFGDVHAAQGDGELCGVALETTAEVTLKLEVLKGKNIDWPRLEDETYIMTTGSIQPLMDCIRIATVELVKWLVDDYGFEKWEAFQVISQAATMRIGNVVDPNYTVVVKFPKKYLPDRNQS